jgi:hypothetical protein
MLHPLLLLLLLLLLLRRRRSLPLRLLQRQVPPRAQLLQSYPHRVPLSPTLHSPLALLHPAA